MESYSYEDSESAYSGIPPTTSVYLQDLRILDGMPINQDPSWSDLFIPSGPDLTSMLEAAASNHVEAQLESDSVSRVGTQLSDSVSGVGTGSSDVLDALLNPDNRARNFLPLIYSI